MRIPPPQGITRQSLGKEQTSCCGGLCCGWGHHYRSLCLGEPGVTQVSASLFCVQSPGPGVGGRPQGLGRRTHKLPIIYVGVYVSTYTSTHTFTNYLCRWEPPQLVWWLLEGLEWGGGGGGAGGVHG